jgi:hypothetical protein
MKTTTSPRTRTHLRQEGLGHVAGDGPEGFVGLPPLALPEEELARVREPLQLVLLGGYELLDLRSRKADV